MTTATDRRWAVATQILAGSLVVAILTAACAAPRPRVAPPGIVSPTDEEACQEHARSAAAGVQGPSVVAGAVGGAAMGSLAGVYALARGNSSVSEGDGALLGLFFGAMMVLGAGVGAIYAAVEDVGARRAASSEAMDACLQPALRAWELGPEHPRVAWSLRDLAYRYYLQSDFADAERLYLGALAILEKTLGADAPEVATILDDYAALLRQTGRAAEAEKLEQRAGTIRSKP